MQNKWSLIISAITWLVLSCVPGCGDPSPVSKLKAEAMAGDAPAQFKLGQMYEGGIQVTNDQAEAVRWYREAARQDHPGAQCRLGLLYDWGNGVTKDATEAARWYRKAAEQGDYIAQFQLAGMYGEGRGVTKDDAEAEKWTHKALSNKSGPSATLLVPSEKRKKIIEERLQIARDAAGRDAIRAAIRAADEAKSDLERSRAEK